MKHINELFKENFFKSKPWLVIGKGPSFSNIYKINIKNYFTFGLNHVVKEIEKLDISHLIDFNVFESCENDIYEKSKFLCIPLNPHFDNEPTDKSLSYFIKKNKTLAKLSEENRLFWYDHLGNYPDRYPIQFNNFERLFYQSIDFPAFSAEVPFHLLGMNNIKNINTIGVDGGNKYSKVFDNSSKLPNGKSTLLSNNQESFDIQFDGIIRAINKYNLNFSTIDDCEPIKVYIGSQEEQMLAVKVLEYSIKKRTSANVEIFPLHTAKINYPVPIEPKNRQRTPFSFQRFIIPELNKKKGRAIYLDSDMQILKDIKQLWNYPMIDHDLLTVKNTDESNRIPQFSVMLLDCGKLDWSINKIVEMLDKGLLNYESLMFDMKVAKNIGVKIDSRWNCLESFDKNTSSLIHYTDMNSQPWISTSNPIGNIWMYDLINAVEDNFISLPYIKNHIDLGWVRPSLLYHSKKQNC